MVGTLSPAVSGNGLNRAPSVAMVLFLPVLGLKELAGKAWPEARQCRGNGSVSSLQESGWFVGVPLTVIQGLSDTFF
jgi:hypothetical protein